MKFDLTQLDPITREFVQSNPGGSAIQVSSRGQRLYYLAVVLLLLFLLKFRWDYFVFFVTGYLMIWYAAAVFFRGGADGRDDVLRAGRTLSSFPALQTLQ